MLSTGWPKLGFSVSDFFLSKHRKNRQRLQFLPPLQNAAPGSKAHRPRGGSTKTAGSSTALATSAGQCIELDRAHGGTHPANGWPAARQQQHGPSSPATPGCAQPWPPAPGSGSSARRHAPGQELASGTRSTHPAKGWPPERARRGHRLPGNGLPWAGGSLRAGALEGESASWPRQASASSYFIDSKKHQHGSTPGKRTRLDQAHGLARCWPPARAAAPRQQAAAQQHQPGPSSPATPGCAQPWPAARGSALSWIRRTVARTRPMAGQRHAQHAPGQGLATRTRQARPSLAGQGVALGWRCFACCSV